MGALRELVTLIVYSAGWLSAFTLLSVALGVCVSIVLMVHRQIGR
jgi:hypothetical protein